MANESGSWIMYGVSETDPNCIHSVEEAIEYIEAVGFLPLFKNSVPGFSLEERTVPVHWWCGDPAVDPWEWREQIARSGRVAYGKFFDQKAGFISVKWLPYFVNWRRDGYDFDALWDDEKASRRAKKIMDLFEADNTELFSYEVKQQAGFSKDGEKNFDGTVTRLMMQTYLCIRDFRQKVSKKGKSYGMDVAIYCKPEHLWGYEAVTSAYREDPEASRERIFAHMRETYPDADEKSINKIIGA